MEIKKNVHITDKNQFWEYVKCQIRTDTILHSSTKAKENKKIENDLKQKLQDLEKKLSTIDSIGEIKFQEYVRTNADWECHISRINSGIIL